MWPSRLQEERRPLLESPSVLVSEERPGASEPISGGQESLPGSEPLLLRDLRSGTTRRLVSGGRIAAGRPALIAGGLLESPPEQGEFLQGRLDGFMGLAKLSGGRVCGLLEIAGDMAALFDGLEPGHHALGIESGRDD